jgi:hypothetical protein
MPEEHEGSERNGGKAPSFYSGQVGKVPSEAHNLVIRVRFTAPLPISESETVRAPYSFGYGYRAITLPLPLDSKPIR